MIKYIWYQGKRSFISALDVMQQENLKEKLTQKHGFLIIHKIHQRKTRTVKPALHWKCEMAER